MMAEGSTPSVTEVMRSVSSIHQISLKMWVDPSPNLVAMIAPTINTYPSEVLHKLRISYISDLNIKFGKHPVVAIFWSVHRRV